MKKYNLILIWAMLSVCVLKVQAQNNTQHITALQFYFDSDPGVGIAGNGYIVTVTEASSISQSFNIVLPSQFNQGLHNLYVRAKDEFGHWGIAERRAFFVFTPDVSQNISAVQYYFDTDPGVGVVGNGAILPLTPNGSVNQMFSITLPASLNEGVHLLYFRTKDVAGRWSIAERKVYYILKANNTSQDLTAIQYYFDVDPGVGVAGNGSIVSISPDSAFNQMVEIIIPNSLSEEYHNLYIRTKDQSGSWSIPERRLIAVGECTNISADSITSWWAFNEINGDEVNDIGGNHNGILVNGVSIIGEDVLKYAQFDGINDYMAVPDNDSWAFGSEDFTIEFLAKFSSPGGDLARPGDKFIGQSEGFGNSKKWMFALGGGQLFFKLSDGSTEQNLVQFPFAPVLNSWYHLGLTRTHDTLRTYINGVLSGSQVVSGLQIPNVNSYLSVGWVEWFQGGDPGFMSGSLDEMTIFHRSLAQQEIADLADAHIAGKCKSLRISTPAISDVLFGSPFSQTLEASMGVESYTWSVTNGALPDGVTLNENGELSGIPTEAGEFAFSVRVTDANNDVADKEFTIKVLLSLTESEISIFKSGTTAVPGRTMDYFIITQNTGPVEIESAIVSELLEPWFTFISSSPGCAIAAEIPNYYTPGDTTDKQPWDIQWDLTLMPEESKIITYKVKLQASFPVGDTVTGTSNVVLPGCLTPQEALDCLQAAKQELESGAIGCAATGSAFSICMSALILAVTKNWEDCILAEANDLNPECIKWAPWPGPANAASDPNEKLVLAPHYIKSDKLLPYVIHFENIGNIEAQDVFIIDTLDEDLDETTLNIISSTGASFNPATRVLKWDLLNINLLPDSSAYVIYTIKPKPNLPSGTVIHNTAHIQFEVFTPMSTNQTENIIDLSTPEGVMDALPATMYQTTFPISWSGMDEVGEIQNYSIFVSENGAGYQLFLSHTKDTSAFFTGTTGKTYSFICIAEDLAGNIEVQEPVAEATTHLDVLCNTIYYYDADNDGYGKDEITTTSCSQPTGFVSNAADCNDANAAIHPGAPEVCNGIDEDCDGLIDEGVTITFYLDEDEDGFGNPTASVHTCTQPQGYVTNGNDCDDNDNLINPNSTEIFDGQDNDCDGLIDEGFSNLTVDAGNCSVVYLGYSPASCTSLSATVNGGSSPYSYVWSNGATTSTISVCPVTTQNYTVTVTDHNGFTAHDAVAVNVVDVRCGNNNSKVVLCHSGQSLCIAPSAVPAHLGHGDYLGVCNAANPCNQGGQSMATIHPKENVTDENSIAMQTKTQTEDQPINEIILFPNPADAFVNIRLPGEEKQGEVLLFDISGKLLKNVVLESGKNNLSTADLENGIYLIQIIHDGERMTTTIVVMH